MGIVSLVVFLCRRAGVAGFSLRFLATASLPALAETAAANFLATADSRDRTSERCAIADLCLFSLVLVFCILLAFPC